MSTEDKAGLNSAVFSRTSKDPMWAGFWLTKYAESENLNRDALAKEVGLSVDGLVLLCLCQTPRVEHFNEDLQAICGRTGAKETAVARIMRQEQALAKWSESPPSQSNTGWLMAAADRTATDDVEDEPENDK